MSYRIVIGSFDLVVSCRITLHAFVRSPHAILHMNERKGLPHSDNINQWGAMIYVISGTTSNVNTNTNGVPYGSMSARQLIVDSHMPFQNHLQTIHSFFHPSHVSCCVAQKVFAQGTESEKFVSSLLLLKLRRHVARGAACACGRKGRQTDTF